MNGIYCDEAIREEFEGFFGRSNIETEHSIYILYAERPESFESDSIIIVNGDNKEPCRHGGDCDYLRNVGCVYVYIFKHERRRLCSLPAKGGHYFRRKAYAAAGNPGITYRTGGRPRQAYINTCVCVFGSAKHNGNKIGGIKNDRKQYGAHNGGNMLAARDEPQL